ncbi:hypothetical protein Tco_1451444 [Tanacetum coccineum]
MKTKKESSDDETSTSESDDEEYAMFVKNFKKFFGRNGRFVRQPHEEKKSYQQRDDKKSKSDRKCFRCYDLNHLISEFPKPPRNKDQKAFVGGCWSDSENEVEDKTNDETYLMAQSSNEVTFDSSHYSDNASSFDYDSMQIEYHNLWDISTLKADGSTLPGSVDLSTSQKESEHAFSPHLSSQSDFVIVRKKVIHNSIENSKRPPLKPSLKNGL